MRYAHPLPTGFIGALSLVKCLIDLPLQPSVGKWVTEGATTLWENWQSTQFAPAGSYNHIMYAIVLAL
jgi:hypothetical protein